MMVSSATGARSLVRDVSDASALSSGSSAAAGRCGCGASQNSSQCRRFAHWHRLVKRGLNDLGTERVGRIDAVLEVHATTHSLLADVADETGEAGVTDRRHRFPGCGSYRGVSTPARNHAIPIDLIDYAPVGCLLQHLTTRFPDDWSFDIVVATNVHHFLYIKSKFLADFHTIDVIGVAPISPSYGVPRKFPGFSSEHRRK